MFACCLCRFHTEGIDTIASNRKEMANMKAETKGCSKCTKYTALAVAVALVLWVPVKMTARTLVGGAFTGRDAGIETQKTAGETFKNILVLKDVPAGELIPSMRYVSASLGVGCDVTTATKPTILTATTSRRSNERAI